MVEADEEKMADFSVATVYCCEVILGIPLECVRLVSFFSVDMLVAYDSGALASVDSTCSDDGSLVTQSTLPVTQ